MMTTSNDLKKYILPFPGVVRIEPASLCNLRCAHCPTGTIEIKRSVMREEIFERIVKEISEYASFIRTVVLYHGGEPLLNKDFMKMVQKISVLGIAHIKTVTNGMLLTPALADEILKSGLTAIEISFDGESEEENEEVRRRVKSEELFANVRYLLERRLATNSKLKVSIASTQFIDPPLRLASTKPPIPLYVYERFKDLGMTKQDYKCTYAMVWPHMNIESSFKTYRDDSGHEDSNICDHTRETITIRADGLVVPCCYDLTSKLPMGNIADHSLMEIWNSDAYLQLRKQIDTKEYPELCKNCNVVRAKKYYLVKAGKGEVLASV